MIWNPIAYDYSKGIIIYDPTNNKEYTEQEVKDSDIEIRRRLCVKGKVVGCWVYTIEELNRNI